jgi:hypothetical protein
MPDAQISPAAPAPAVVVNSRDTRILGSHPQQGHTTNGKGVQIHGDQTVRTTMGASGARVAAPNGLPQGTPKAQTGAAISTPTPTPASVAKPAAKATTAKADGVLTSAEAALCLDIVEGQVAQVVIASPQTSPMLELAKDVVKKLRVQAGVPATVPLPWDLAPAAIAPVPVPVPAPVPVPDPAAAPVLPESSQGPASPDRAAAAGGGAQVDVGSSPK